MRQATLVFLIKKNKILLAMKKRAFGKGKWNDYGGKVKPGENITNTAIRETQEESGVTPKNLIQMATLYFYYQNKPEWDQQVLVFITHKWNGVPIETEEMKPKWFNLNNIPFKSMWIDDSFWLPLILEGKKIKAKFTFDQNNNILSQKINEI